MASDAIPFRGPNVWRHPTALVGFFVLLGIAWTALAAWFGFTGEIHPAQAIVLGPPALPVVWGMFVHPRLVLTDDEVIVVGLMTMRYRLSDIVGAEPGYHGTWFQLANGDGFMAAMLEHPNYAAWLGIRSRADRVATTILTAAAAKRGEPAPEPIGGKRGKGDLGAGISMGL
ncbi:MAG TPA: hypothetical protein VGE38_11565 [Nocardioides sp.]|uniref:hypothetical protein n=1 Tax=Nocardioides sp. TaxID=35761 RepID=UPI002ED7B961